MVPPEQHDDTPYLRFVCLCGKKSLLSGIRHGTPRARRPYSSGCHSKMSPGWQSSSRQMASNVEKRTALTRPHLRRLRLTSDTPIFSARSFERIFLSASTLSSLTTITASPLAF